MCHYMGFTDLCRSGSELMETLGSELIQSTLQKLSGSELM